MPKRILSYCHNVMILLICVQILAAKSLIKRSAASSFGCTTLDHSACDELCKTDLFWYGHCSAWDGMDFQCKCYEYKAPLDPKICSNYKEYCNTLCAKKNKQNGYCYPALSPKDTRGIPQCECFKNLSELF